MTRIRPGKKEVLPLFVSSLPHFPTCLQPIFSAAQWLCVWSFCLFFSFSLLPGLSRRPRADYTHTHTHTQLWLTLSERHLEQRGVDWKQAEKVCFNEWSNPDDEELGIQIVKVRRHIYLRVYMYMYVCINVSSLSRRQMGIVRVLITSIDALSMS